LIAALEPEDVVLGEGNAKRLEKLPAGCRAGDNANAFLGGFRLWESTTGERHSNRLAASSGYLHHHTKGMQTWQQ